MCTHVYIQRSARKYTYMLHACVHAHTDSFGKEKRSGKQKNVVCCSGCRRRHIVS